MKLSKVAGRIGVYAPDHPKVNNAGYVLRSRYLVEQYLGRYLEENEEVHHKNRNKLDDRIENLEVLTVSQHAKLHYLKGDVGFQRKLDYKKIESLVNSGCGYKKISKLLGYNVHSVKSAVRVIKRG